MIAPTNEFIQNLTQIDQCIPDLSIRSSVALVQPSGTLLRQIGSGTLLAVAEHKFIVTAAHVVRCALKDGRTLGVSGSINDKFVATSGKWIVSGGEDNSEDPFDVAIYEFSSEQSSHFIPESFVRIGDVSFEEDLSNKYFLVTGFPGMWSTTSANDVEPIKSRLLQYGTYAFRGNTVGLTGFRPDHHILLEAKPEDTVDNIGNPISFRTRNGFPAQIPADLAGISGSSVWAIGDLQIPMAAWSSKHSRLVGIETSVYAIRGVIKATRWNAITTLLYQAFPAVRPTIEMYIQTGS
jgi:hypothetical protein